MAIRDKETLCLVRPYQEALALETMFYADEVRPVSGLDLPDFGRVRIALQEMNMAVSLIDNLTNRFDASRYSDE